MSDKLAPTERHKFTHQGQTVYEWDQTLTELNLYVELPPGIRGKDLFVDITATHLRIGLKPNPPYLDVSTRASSFTIGEKQRDFDAHTRLASWNLLLLFVGKKPATSRCKVADQLPRAL